MWLCGSGEMEEEIRAYAAQDSRIRFFGFLPHEEAVQLQKKATVLVNPRTNQGELNFFLALCVVDGMVSAMMRRLENDPNSEESVPDASNLHADL